jgi:carbon starvation protein CstA
MSFKFDSLKGRYGSAIFCFLLVALFFGLGILFKFLRDNMSNFTFTIVITLLTIIAYYIGFSETKKNKSFTLKTLFLGCVMLVGFIFALPAWLGLFIREE